MVSIEPGAGGALTSIKNVALVADADRCEFDRDQHPGWAQGAHFAPMRDCAGLGGNPSRIPL
jgi:hypothetical protein